MSRPAGPYVLDASVGIKLFVPESGSEQVRAMLGPSLLGLAEALLVPGFFYAECANILWKKVRSEAYPEEAARENLIGLRKMALVVTPTRDLATDALEVACQYDCSVYDACYLALSERKGIPLLTADHKLVEMLQGAPFQIAVLG